MESNGLDAAFECAGQQETIDQCMQVLTGIEPGERDALGGFPEGTLNHRITENLIDFAENLRRFGSRETGLE